MQSGASSRAADAIATIIGALMIVLIGGFLVMGIVVGSMSHTRNSQAELSVIRVQTNNLYPDLSNLTEKSSGFFPTQPSKPTNVTKIFPIPIPLANEPQDQLTLFVGSAGVGGVSALSMFLDWIIPPGTNLGPISLHNPKAAVLARQNGYTNPTIVLLHGFVEQRARFAFEELIPLLSDDFSVLFPDLRGFGGSGRSILPFNTVSKNRKMMNLTNLVLDLRMTLDQVQGYNTEEQRHHSIVLVATDLLSGMVAYQFASQYPQYLKGLITIQSAHPNVLADLLRSEQSQRDKLFEKNRLLSTLTAIGLPMAEKVKLVQANDYAMLSEQLATTAKSKEFFEANKGKYFNEWSNGAVLSAQAMLYTSMFKGPKNTTVEQTSDQFLKMDFTFADQTYNINVPTLAMYGDSMESNDGLMYPENAVKLSQYVKSDLYFKPFADASGNVLHENTNEVALAIKNFIIGLMPKPEPQPTPQQ